MKSKQDNCRMQKQSQHAIEAKKLQNAKDRVLKATGNRGKIYSLRHRKCGVRGFIHELFVSKPERARYERVRAFDTNNE